MLKLIEPRRVFLLIVGFLLAAADAAAAPACGGRDLIAQLRDNAPQVLERLNAEAAETVNGEGLLWRVEKAGVAPSHLFGTIHVTDPRVTTLPEPVRAALKGARVVAVEVVDALDRGALAKKLPDYKAQMYFADGRSLAEHLSAAHRAKIAKLLKALGADIAAFGAMKPWVVGTALALPACETVRQKELDVVDKVVADTAREAGIRLVSLESLEEQFAAFEAVPLDMQAEYLIASVRMYPHMEDLLATMTELYVRRRVAAIQMLDRVLGEAMDFPESGQAVLDELLVERRNAVMLGRAVPLIDRGSAFIAIGALHLPGDEGLVELLRAKGYRVTRVY